VRRLHYFWINLRRAWRRRRPPVPAAPQPQPGPPRVDFSYTIFWTRQARAWSAERRAQVADGLAEVLAQPGFETNDYARRYRVPALDGQAYAGASLNALARVLEALARDDAGRRMDEVSG
jgi:hypothetical protein